MLDNFFFLFSFLSEFWVKVKQKLRCFRRSIGRWPEGCSLYEKGQDERLVKEEEKWRLSERQGGKDNKVFTKYYLEVCFSLGRADRQAWTEAGWRRRWFHAKQRQECLGDPIEAAYIHTYIHKYLHGKWSLLLSTWCSCCETGISESKLLTFHLLLNWCGLEECGSPQGCM